MDFKKEFGFEENLIKTEMEKQIVEEEEKLNVTYSIHNFTEKFKGKYLNNPTTNPNAKYYVLNMKNKTYLQTHKPYVQGFEAITDDNAEEVINNHINNINENHERTIKFKKALTSLKSKQVIE